MKYLVGVDEVGRGPLAGPLCVGVCAVPSTARRRFGKIFREVKDSKQLSEVRREEWRKVAISEQRNKAIIFRTSFVSHTIIDRRGMAFALRLAIRRCLAKLELEPGRCRVLLDGGIRAPEEFFNQKTIIGGDAIEPVISLASIVAKVRRDRHMKKLAKKFPGYGFEIHKGYGTKGHYAALKKHGLCPIHRRSFLKKLLQ